MGIFDFLSRKKSGEDGEQLTPRESAAVEFYSHFKKSGLLNDQNYPVTVFSVGLEPHFMPLVWHFSSDYPANGRLRTRLQCWATVP